MFINFWVLVSFLLNVRLITIFLFFFLFFFCLQNNVVFVSFLVLTISISHFGVSGQYIPYRSESKENESVTDRRIDTATDVEYYYDDEIEADLSTTHSIPSTTTTSTTTTTTPKPITSYRFSTTHRNGFRPFNYNKKKQPDTTTKLYQPDSYTEASNESAFVQKQVKPTATPTPQLRNAIAEVNRRTTGKDYTQEKSSELINGTGNNNYVSRRYARFLFKLRSG